MAIRSARQVGKSFLREKERVFALRFNSDKPSLVEAQASLSGGGNRSFRLLSLPLYMTGQAMRLCRENM